MKALIISTLLFVSAALCAQQSSDEILASNDVNAGKTHITLLTSEFESMNVEQMDGIYKLLNEEGRLVEVRAFKKGELDGTWLQYDKNENLIAIANYKDNEKHGKWVIWDENGTKRYELFYQNGVRTGTWKSWDENGNLASSKVY